MTKKKARGATRREHLTEKRIAALPVPGRTRVIVYDVETPDLGLKIEPTGAKTFFWFRAVAGKPTWRTIGAWPETSLETARATAQSYNVALADWRRGGCVGSHPFERPRAGQMTLTDLVESYVERHVMLECVNPTKRAKECRRTRDKYLADWKDRRLGAITRQDVHDLHQRLGVDHGKVTANRICEFLRTIYNYATGDANLWHGENPAARIKMFDERQRERYLAPDELLRLKKELDKETDGDLRDFITLALATGARKSNIHAMGWADISWETQTWMIPRTKNDKPQNVDLTPAAVTVLKERVAARKGDNPWVFPSPTSASGHVEDFRKRWYLLRTRAGLDYPKDPTRRVTIHDLRRTFASYMAISGVSLQQIGAALGHRDTQSTEVYARLHREAVRGAIETGSRKMAQMMAAAKKRQKQRLLETNLPQVK